LGTYQNRETSEISGKAISLPKIKSDVYKKQNKITKFKLFPHFKMGTWREWILLGYCSLLPAPLTSALQMLLAVFSPHAMFMGCACGLNLQLNLLQFL